MRSPSDPRPAEEGFQTAIAVANAQGARGYALMASYSLAKLCEATGRRKDGKAILASALEGFLPTPEMPEIAEAQALLGASSRPWDVVRRSLGNGNYFRAR
jgi:hypothetical protein